jgi:hypothetical protein
MTVDRNVLPRLLSLGNIRNAFGKLSVKHGFVHEVGRQAPYPEVDTLIHNRPIELPIHTMAEWDVQFRLVVGTKDTTGITTRYRLDLRMFGNIWER